MFAVLSLLLLGLLFLLIELFLVPGTSVFGIVGAISMVAGIVVSYMTYGMTGGSYFLAGTFVAAGVAVVTGLQSKTWRRFALKNTMSGKKVEDSVLRSDLQVGATGVASSTLRPGGTATFGEHEVQVKALSGIIDKGVAVRVQRIDGPYVYVVEFEETSASSTNH